MCVRLPSVQLLLFCCLYMSNFCDKIIPKSQNQFSCFLHSGIFHVRAFFCSLKFLQNLFATLFDIFGKFPRAFHFSCDQLSFYVFYSSFTFFFLTYYLFLKFTTLQKNDYFHLRFQIYWCKIILSIMYCFSHTMSLMFLHVPSPFLT